MSKLSILGIFLISLIYSCNNTGRTNNTLTDPLPEEIVIPSILDYSAVSISSESVKLSIDNQDLIDIIYDRDREEHTSVGSSITVDISIDIADLSIYEEVINVSCPKFEATLSLTNTNGTDFDEANEDTLHEGIISVTPSETMVLDCLSTDGDHYPITIYNRTGILLEKKVDIDTKIIFTENKITGVLGFKRANESDDENNHIFF